MLHTSLLSGLPTKKYQSVKEKQKNKQKKPLFLMRTWGLIFQRGAWGFHCGTPVTCNGSHTASFHAHNMHPSTATRFEFWNWGWLSQKKSDCRKTPKLLGVGLGPVCFCLCISEKEKMSFSWVRMPLSQTTALKHYAQQLTAMGAVSHPKAC